MRARIRAVTAPAPGRDRAGACSGQQLPEKVVSMRLVRTLLVTSLVGVVLALAATPAGAQSLALTRASSMSRLRRTVCFPTALLPPDSLAGC